jgi:hypothetical protein
VKRGIKEEEKMRSVRSLAFLFASLLLLVPLESLAEESEHAEHTEAHYHRHHIGLFLGNTHEEGEDEFTVGLDYEYRFTQYFGIGVLLEYVGEDEREGIGLVPLFIHPYKGFRFMVGPGVKPKAEETKFVWRLGIGYRFPIRNWTGVWDE